MNIAYINLERNPERNQHIVIQILTKIKFYNI